MEQEGQQQQQQQRGEGAGADAGEKDKWNVRRLVLCTGKVYFDIIGHKLYADASGVAVARIEQLYPFPTEAARYANLKPTLDEYPFGR